MTIPNWTNDVLQGLCYWVGHRYSYYFDYPLGESALVGELCNLLSAKITSDQKLLSEVMRKNLGVKTKDSTRCDLVIVNKAAGGRDDDVSNDVITALEIKRACAGDNKFIEDLYRQHEFLKAQSNLGSQAQAFLIVVSQRERPSIFVTEQGCAVKREKTCEYDDGNSIHTVKYHVRRVCKATNSFGDQAPERAYYAVMIEVVL
ncbi:hypothetical protein D8T48_21250 [Vibrio vulnificus]|uniref:hypothetical protein n=1 Tax=Vibrio vulnificus TaxID=672 RepID=UPI001028EE4C|nr:hypothetical protein [Vibrio vulnificus]RZP54028.1 hypothetical protein D8T48_21250 [Vibrio vulnificus]